MILTRNEAIGRLNKLVVAPATGRIRGIPTEVGVTHGEGMPHDSVINLDNTALVRKFELTDLITELNLAKMSAICRALNTAVGCS